MNFCFLQNLNSVMNPCAKNNEMHLHSVILFVIYNILFSDLCELAKSYRKAAQCASNDH